MANNANPTNADVVIVGGGIVGCTAALYLAKRGLAVVLFEADEIGRAQSGRNWGFIRQQGRDPSELPMMMESSRIWANAEKELGVDFEWTRGGNLAIAATPEKMSLFEDWSRVAREHKLDTELVSPAKLRTLIPDMRGDWEGAMYTASDAHAEPRKATQAFCAAARAAGARVFEHCAVDRIETQNGAVSAVWTQKGRIKTSSVIGAAGAWAAKLLRPLGLNLPVRWVRSSVVRIKPLRPITNLAVWAPGVSFSQRRDGSLKLGGGGWTDFDFTLDSLRDVRLFMPNYWVNRKLFQLHIGKPLLLDLLARLPGSKEGRHPFSAPWTTDPPPNPAKMSRVLSEFRRMFPAIGDVTMIDSWAGYMDATPDALPVLDSIEKPRGLVLATGLSGHGFGLGPIVGRLAAELVTEGKTSFDIKPFRFSRFKEAGYKPKPRSVL